MIGLFSVGLPQVVRQDYGTVNSGTRAAGLEEGVVLPNSVAGRAKGVLRGVNGSHLSYLGNGRGWTQNKRCYSARGAAPRAIQSKDCDPPPFVRPQSIRVPEQQSRAGGGMGGQGGPELADGLRSRHISLLP